MDEKEEVVDESESEGDELIRNFGFKRFDGSEEINWKISSVDEGCTQSWQTQHRSIT